MAEPKQTMVGGSVHRAWAHVDRYCYRTAAHRMDFVMNALKADLSVPYHERIGPLPALQRCSTGTPLQKSKLAVEEFIEAFNTRIR